MNTRFLPAAETELRDAITRYEKERAGLGQRFLLEVVRSLRGIENFPAAYPALSARTRRCLLSSFPYAIVYRYDEPESAVLVLAVAHLHRRPDYWSDRR